MSESKDIKPPLIKRNRGAHHPIKQTQKNILDFLIKLGFEVIDGPEIETEEFNFDLLNIKKIILHDKCMILFMLMKSLIFLELILLLFK